MMYKSACPTGGLLNYELDDDGLKAFEQQTAEGRELLSILANNAAQMCAFFFFFSAAVPVKIFWGKLFVFFRSSW